MEVGQDCLGLILAPAETIPRVVQRGTLANAVGVMLAALATVFAAGLATGTMQAAAKKLKVEPMELFVYQGLQFLLLWLVGTVMLYLAGRILGGEGRLLPLLVVIGYAHIVIVPMVALGLAAGLGHAPGAVYKALGVIWAVWIALLGMLAVREVLKLTSGRALGALLLAMAMGLMLSAVARGPARAPAGQQPPAPKAAPAR